MRFHGWKPLRASHHLARFDVLWPGASEDTIYLVCPVTSQAHAIERSSDVMGNNL